MALNQMRRVAAPIAAQPTSGDVMPGRPRIQYVEDYFVYTVSFAALAPAQVQNGNIQIQADSDFKWVKATYQADIAAADYDESTRPVALVTLQLSDTGSGRQLFQSATALENVFGRGELPFINPIARIFKARSNIQVTVANFSAADTYNLRLAFIGLKVFEMQPAPGLGG